LSQSIRFIDGKIVERFDCYEGTSAKAKLAKDLYVQGVNFFARKPLSYGDPQHDRQTSLDVITDRSFKV
jgi:hypothetical protein